MRALSLVLIAAVCSACSEKTARLDLPVTEIRSPAVLEASKSGQLLISWRPLEDRRSDINSIGRIGLTVYSSQSIATWLNGEFAVITGKGFVVTADSATADIIITPCLQKMYLEGLDVNKTAVIVIELDFSYRDRISAKRIFRGLYTGMNWAGSDDEMIRALQNAFADCRRRIIFSLESEARIVRANHT